MLLPLPATVDLSARTKLKLAGTDRLRYLNGQVTNDVRQLDRPGASCYACVTNAKGRLEADVFITELGAGEDAFLIDADPSLREDLFARLEKYIIADDVRLEDVTETLALLHVLEIEAGRAVPASGSATLDSVLLAAPINRFGVPGTDLVFPAELRETVLAELPACADPALLEALRIAHGIPQWGAELTPDILPPEAGLQERAISYTKGCYIGQEVISRIKSVGRVNRQLVALRLVAENAPAGDENRVDDFPLTPGLVVYTNNPEKPSPIGILTSCTSHPALDAPIALGYVKREHLAPGTRVRAGTDAHPLAFLLEIAKSPLI